MHPELTANPFEYFHPANLQLKYNELETSQHYDSIHDTFILISNSSLHGNNLP